MKKLDLQKGDIKTKLILHVEKIVFGVAVALVAAFVYLGTQQEKIDTTPQRVEEAAKGAEQNIAKSTWESVAESRWTPPTYQASAVRASTPMPGQPYEMPLSFRIRHKESIEKRADPTMLPLEDLEVTAGFAPMAMMDPTMRNRQGGTGYMDEMGGPGGAPAMGFDEYGMGARGVDESKVPPTLTPEQRLKFGSVRGGQNTKVEGKPFVVVKELIPLKKQLDLYDAEFKDRANYNEGRDYPRYISFKVERSEMRPDGTWADWRGLSTEQAFTDARTKWAFKPQEVAAPWYLDPILTFPLPPLLLRDAGKWGLHSEVPKYEPPDQRLGMGRGMAQLEPEEEMPEEEENQDAVPANGPTGLPGGLPGIPGMGRGPGGMRGMGGPGGYDTEMGYEDPYSSGGYGPSGMTGRGRLAAPPNTVLRRTGGAAGGSGGGYGADPGYGGGAGYGSEMGGGYTGGTSPYDAERKLFRFVDATVRSNTTYRYRVQLWLEDPNYPQNPQVAPTARALEQDVLSRLAEVRRKDEEINKQHPGLAQPWRTYYRTTDFSDASEAVQTPGSSSVLAGRVEAGRRVMQTGVANPRVLMLRDPVATVLGMRWDPAKEVGALVTQELKGLTRGSIIENKGDLWVLNPGTLAFEQKEDYNFRTSMMVLDMRGGEDLPGRLVDANKERLKTPGEVLVMDAATGKVSVRNELQDADEFNLFNFAKPEVKKQPKSDAPEDYYGDYGYEEEAGGRPNRRNRQRGGGP
ncbi:MAG: hypothetical protein WD045_10285 [Pirellulaceae bacterium]